MGEEMKESKEYDWQKIIEQMVSTVKGEHTVMMTTNVICDDVNVYVTVKKYE